jgi:hypothetical protein
MTGIVIWGVLAIAAMLAARSSPSGKTASVPWMAWCFVLPPLAIVLAFLPRADAAPK